MAPLPWLALLPVVPAVLVALLGAVLVGELAPPVLVLLPEFPPALMSKPACLQPSANAICKGDKSNVSNYVGVLGTEVDEESAPFLPWSMALWRVAGSIALPPPAELVTSLTTQVIQVSMFSTADEVQAHRSGLASLAQR